MFKCGTITIMVSDMDKSVKFYTEILGLKLKSRYGNDYAEVEIDSLNIGLHPSKQKIKPTESLQIGFAVDSLEKEVARLEKNGAGSFNIVSEPQIKLALFKDPDGYTLYLAEMNKEWK